MSPKIIFLVFAFTFRGYTAMGQDIFQACREGNDNRIRELIAIKADTVNSRNEAGFTPLIIAAYRGQPKAVSLLLENGADVNASSGEGAALLAACYQGNIEITEMLLRQGPLINAVNDHGTHALIIAVLGDNIALVSLLLKHGADKNLAENSGKTALSYAQLYNKKEILQLLSGN